MEGSGPLSEPEGETVSQDREIAGIELGRMLAGERHSPVVYFVWCAGAVKIGTTTRLRTRIAALYLRLSDVILIVPGGREVERAYHDRLRQHQIREPGRRELFSLDGVLSVLSLKWERPTPKADPARSIGVPFLPSRLAVPGARVEILPVFTVECRERHAFGTRARGGASISCPVCRRAGFRVSVWVPVNRPESSGESRGTDARGTDKIQENSLVTCTDTET